MLINIDRGVYNLNKEYQLGEITIDDVQVGTSEIIDFNIIANQEKFKALGIDLKKVLKEVREYLVNRTPYDFYYSGKRNIKMSINKHIKK